MGIFDRFPYSSTHEMNLDFMLGKATEIAEDMQTVATGMAQVQAGLSAISEKTEQATQAAAQAAQSASSIEGSVTAAEEAAEEAQMHNESAQTWANNALTYKADCQRAATEAAASSSSAAQAATAAAASEDTVATYAQAANASAQSAANNNDSAHQYANQASASASNATFHSSNAQTAATNAQTAATNANTSATNASASADRAASLKTDVETLHRMCTAAVDQAATEAVNAANSAAQAAAAKTDVETLVESLPEDFTDLNNTVNQLSDEIAVEGYFNTITGFDGIETYSGYVNESGEFVSATSGWVRTDYIPTAEGASIVASLKGYLSNPIVAYYDANKTYLSEKSIPSNSQLVVNVDTVVPEGVSYAVIVSQTTYDGASFAIGTPAPINDALNIVADDVYGYKGVKILCMGDSLTAGRDGNANILVHNYPYWMRETTLKKSVIDNKGVIGSTTLTYWRDHMSNLTLDSSIDLVLMMWGTNGGLVDTSRLALDVEPYDNYEDYAETGVGCYCKIIEYVMEHTQNHAQIILITPPYNGDTSINSRVINAQAVVKQIAERYNLPVIDMFKCGISKFNYATYMPIDSVHFSEAGYRYIGTYIGNCVSAISARKNV